MIVVINGKPKFLTVMMTKQEYIDKTLKALYGTTSVSPDERRYIEVMADRAASVYPFTPPKDAKTRRTEKPHRK